MQNESRDYIIYSCLCCRRCRAEPLGAGGRRRAAAVRAQLKPGDTPLDSGRRRAAGLRPQLRLQNRHGRPADHRGPAGPKRAVHLLRCRERHQGCHGYLQRHHPSGPAPSPACWANSGPLQILCHPAGPHWASLLREASGPGTSPPPLRATLLQEHGGHISVPHHHPRKPVCGPHRGAGLRGLLPASGQRREVLFTGRRFSLPQQQEAQQEQETPRKLLPHGAEDHLKPLQRQRPF